ncbi:hypothetical protein PMAYCL1PPCAC_15635, partial [Pristionchus mayeri]
EYQPQIQLASQPSLHYLHQRIIFRFSHSTGMGFFRRVFMDDERIKHSGVPAIPTDIGYKAGKETKGAKES